MGNIFIPHPPISRQSRGGITAESLQFRSCDVRSMRGWRGVRARRRHERLMTISLELENIMLGRSGRRGDAVTGPCNPAVMSQEPVLPPLCLSQVKMSPQLPS